MIKICVKCGETWEAYNGGGTICDDCIEHARYERMQWAEKQAGLEVRRHFQRVIWFRVGVAVLLIALGVLVDVALMFQFGRWFEARGLATAVGFGLALVWASRVWRKGRK